MTARLPADDEPLVRPFYLTGGRTRGRIPLDALVVRTAEVIAAPGLLEIEHRRILELCEQPRPVAEVAGALGLPLGVVRVLLDDLVRFGVVQIAQERPAVDEALLDRLIQGVERL